MIRLRLRSRLCLQAQASMGLASGQHRLSTGLFGAIRDMLVKHHREVRLSRPSLVAQGRNTVEAYPATSWHHQSGLFATATRFR
jgi:hypothetical protein